MSRRALPGDGRPLVYLARDARERGPSATWNSGTDAAGRSPRPRTPPPALPLVVEDLAEEFRRRHPVDLRQGHPAAMARLW